MLSKNLAAVSALALVLGSSAAAAQSVAPVSAPVAQSEGSELSGRGAGIYIIGAVVIACSSGARSSCSTTTNPAARKVCPRSKGAPAFPSGALFSCPLLHNYAENCIDSTMIDVAILGASGFVGAELLRLCAGHPGLARDASVRRQPGRTAGRCAPSPPRAGLSRMPVSSGLAPAAARGGAALFSRRCPHGQSQRAAPEILAARR